jgi:2-polyprenyl-3-methyl-5-hydroxy-6-metoxy-1,4-benzoquinol methylase
MIIGQYLSRISKNKITYLIYKFFGIPDLHSHLRLKPVFKHLKNELKKKQINILEIGCGGGIIPFQLLEEKKKFTYLGIDIDSVSINCAKIFLENYKNHSISFINESENFNINKNQLNLIDVLLLIDVLEHLKDPNSFLNTLLPELKNDCLVFVSVPTPLYPKIFGEAFHIGVGHLMDGYTIDSLDEVFNKNNFFRSLLKYNTGILSNLGCATFYRITASTRLIIHIKSILFSFFKYLDIINNKKVSCSIFAIYKRE